MTGASKRTFALVLGLSILGIACNRENEAEPMTPASATGQPRQVPDSRYDDKGPDQDLDGTAPPTEPDPTNPGLSPTTPGAGPGTTAPGS